MRAIIKINLENAIRTVKGYSNSESGRCWEKLFEARIESLKEDLTTAKPERVVEIQGAIKELRQIIKQVKGNDAE